MFKKVLFLIGLVLFLLSSVQAEDYAIVPTSNQDAPIYGIGAGGAGVYVELNFGIGWFGIYGGGQMSTVSIFTFPEGISAVDIISATLVVPQPDAVWDHTQEGYPENYDFDLVHIDANSDTKVCVVDIVPSRELDVIGSFRAAGPVVVDNTRTISYDVTNLVKADLNALRASFAFKTKTNADNDPNTTYNYFYFPTVDNTDPTFPQKGAKLVLSMEGVASGPALTNYSGPDKGIWHKNANWSLGVPGAASFVYMTDVEFGGSDVWITKSADCFTYVADDFYNKVTVDGGDFTVNGELKLGGWTHGGTQVWHKGEMYIQEGTVRVKGDNISAYLPNSRATIDIIGPNAVLQLDKPIPDNLQGDGRIDILNGMLVMPGKVTDISVAGKHWKTMAWGGAGTFVYDYNTPNHRGMTEITAVNNPAAPSGLVVTPSSGLTVTEGGAATSYTIKLSYNPDPCTVTVNIYGGYHVTTSISQATFNKTNYNTPVTVTVTPVNDLLYEGSKTIYIKHELDTNSATPINPAAPLNPLSESDVWVPVVVVDNAGDGGYLITESGGSTTVTEGGATDSFTVALRTTPTSGKTVTVNLSAGTVNKVNQVSIEPKTLTFTSANYTVPQTVTVTALDDAVLDKTQTVSIRLGSTIAPSLWTSPYAALGGFVYATVIDNECGAWGYESSDANKDCKVDIYDLDNLVAQWLLCTDPEGTDCVIR